MPAHVVRHQGALRVYYDHMATHQVWSHLDEELYRMRHATTRRTWWWRCTNDPQEHRRVGAVRSTNHADGIAESGMSVSEHPGYQVVAGYRYIYPVTGQVVGTGSDGEPVLADAQPLGVPRRAPHQGYLRRGAALDARPPELRGTMQEIYRVLGAPIYGEPPEGGDVVITVW